MSASTDEVSNADFSFLPEKSREKYLLRRSNCSIIGDCQKIMAGNESTNSSELSINYANYNIKLNIKKGNANISVTQKGINISIDLTHRTQTSKTTIQTEDIRNFRHDTGDIISDTNSADTDVLEISSNSEKQKDLSVIMEYSEENISETNQSDKTKSVSEGQLVEDDSNMFDLGPTEECYVQPLTPGRAPKRTQSPALEYKSYEKGPPKKKLKTALSQDMGSEVPGPDTQARSDTTPTPDICRDLAASEDMLPGDNAPEPIVCTPEESNSWEDQEETPQKNISGLELMNRSKTGAVNITSKSPTNTDTQARRDFCVAWTGLNVGEIKNIQRLCRKRGWKFVTDYVNEITHLIVATDEENKMQKTVKYMRALAAGKWIISYKWIEMCLKNKDVVEEEPFEILDKSGYSGPKRARTSQRDLFKGIVFYCMSPYGVLNAESLAGMLEAAGGKVVRDIKQVKATSGGPPALLLAEPEQAEQAKFSELAIDNSVVPVHFEWAVNCLASYSLMPIDDLLLCPKSMVADAISHWPVALVLP